MDLTVLNTNLEAVGIVDSFISLIWTQRYFEAGDFELCLPMDTSLLEVLKEDYYVVNSESESVMIIEDIEITTDAEDGERLIITGRSLEQLLSRRIVWNKTNFSRTYADSSDNVGTIPNFQNGIKQLLNENVISPAIAARAIPKFKFEESTDKAITELTIEAQYYGETIYDILKTLCEEHQIGFKITLDPENYFVFKLYAGTDRTYDQSENPYVVFSPDNDNLFNSSYYRSRSGYKNIVLVAGEEYENSSGIKVRETISVTDGTDIVGINRREIFADADDITSKDDDITLTDEQYRAHLKQRGIDTLIENLESEAFEGEVEATVMYRYGEDFFMGDYVQLVDKYGHEGQAYISEFVISQNQEGITMYPTFITLEKGEYTYE